METDCETIEVEVKIAGLMCDGCTTRVHDAVKVRVTLQFCTISAVCIYLRCLACRIISHACDLSY